MRIDTIESLFEEELKDLYDAEKQLVGALPKMAKASTSDELRSAFEEHLEATKGQVARLEEVFQSIDAKPKGKTCEAMKGLIAEGQEAIDEDAEDSLRDAMLIGAAKRVEHYEMAAYQSAILLAESLTNRKAATLLRETLDEEEEADGKLTTLCEELLRAIEPTGEEEEERAAARPKTRRAGS